MMHAPYGSVALEIAILPGGDPSTVSNHVGGLVDSISRILPQSDMTVIWGLAVKTKDDDFEEGGLALTSGSELTMLPLDQVAISDGSDAALLGFDDVGAAEEALSSGRIAVSDPDVLSSNGTITVERNGHTAVEWPATVVSAPKGAFAIAGPVAFADALDLTTSPTRIIALPERDTSFTTRQVDSVRMLGTAALAPDASVTASLERGYQPDTTIQALRGLSLGVAVVAGLLAWAMTLLAVREQRREAAVISAVGATPRMVGAVGAIQSATLTGIGTVLGATAGTALILLVIGTFSRNDSTWMIAIPWTVLVVVVFGGPTLAAIVGGITHWRRATELVGTPPLRD